MKIATSPLAAAPAPVDKAHADLKKATQQFEAYFLDTLLKEMRKTVPQNTLLGDDSHGQEIFRDMMDQTLADRMSERGDFGIGKLLYDQLGQSLPDSPAAGREKDGKNAGGEAPKPKAALDIHR